MSKIDGVQDVWVGTTVIIHMKDSKKELTKEQLVEALKDHKKAKVEEFSEDKTFLL